MKFFTSKIRYSILAGLAAYGTYKLVFDIIGIGSTLQNCNLSSEGTITIICSLFGMSLLQFLCEIGIFHSFTEINGQIRCKHCNKLPGFWDFFWGS